MRQHRTFSLLSARCDLQSFVSLSKGLEPPLDRDALHHAYAHAHAHALKL